MRITLKAALTVLSVLGAAPVYAQGVNLTVNDVGISIGDSRRVTGIRLNYRDSNLEKVVGINATLWGPYRNPRGVVQGLALGLPLTGARRIDGIGAGIFGVAVDQTLRGIGVGGIGLGVGEDLKGIAIGGIGLGAGRDLRGIAIGGIGAGVGQDIHGLAIGGIGVGAGQNATGIVIGGIGAGIGQNLTGLGIGGIGVGAGADVTGILIGGIGAAAGQRFKGLAISGVGIGAGESIQGVTIAGIGIGSGGDVTGVQVAGVGLGSGGTLKWLSVAGLGVGAPRIEGVAIASAVGGENVRGFVFAPAYFRITNEGEMRGVNISGFNNVRGLQRGLAIGLFNFAHSLDGVQLGILNYAGNKRHGKLLPLVNYARGRR